MTSEPQTEDEPDQGNPENFSYQDIPEAPENVSLLGHLARQNQETMTYISISFVVLKVDFQFFSN